MSETATAQQDPQPAAITKPPRHAPEPPRHRRWPFFTSLALNAVLTVALILALQKPDPKPVDLSKNTQQDLAKAQMVRSGATATSVQQLLGAPAVRELSASGEEWHYCRTGATVDEYVAIAFTDEKVQSVQYYTVSWLDLVFHYAKQPTEKLIEVGGMGDCRLTVRWGTYGQRTPSYPENRPAHMRNAEPPASSPTAK